LSFIYDDDDDDDDCDVDDEVYDVSKIVQVMFVCYDTTNSFLPTNILNINVRTVVLLRKNTLETQTGTPLIR
jgi:hypothetical protein